MSDLELEQHRGAYRIVMEALPGSVWVSHEVELNGGDWERLEIDMPILTLQLPLGCLVCGDPIDARGLTKKCRDRHEVCNECGERFDKPRGKGCRRRKHAKETNNA